MGKFTEEEGTGMPDEGFYDVYAVEYEEKAGPKGPYLEWKIAIYTGKFDGKDFRLYTSYSPKAMFKFIEMIEATGIKKTIEKDDDGKIISIDFEADDMIGKHFQVKAEHGTYKKGNETKKNCQIAEMLPPRENQPLPPKADGASQASSSGAASGGASSMSKDEIDEIPF